MNLWVLDPAEAMTLASLTLARARSKQDGERDEAAAWGLALRFYAGFTELKKGGRSSMTRLIFTVEARRRETAGK